MAARFKKNTAVLLFNEEEDDILGEDIEAESSLLSGEEDVQTNNNVEMREHDGEEGVTLMSPSISQLSWWKNGRWKVWKRRKQYHVHPSSSSNKFCKVNSWKAVFIALSAFTMAIVISIIISRLVVEPTLPPSPADSPVTTRAGAVSSDAAVCADMSADILRQGGSAVDAAITTMLCNGLVHAESSGIGGGGFMVVRLANGSVYSLNFRESAPSASTTDMFHSNESTASKGGLSVAVPGEVKGMEKAHQLFGRLKWKSLFTPVIELCRHGYKLTPHTVEFLDSHWNELPSNIQAIYSYVNGTRKQLGDLVQRPLLAETLEKIAEGGSKAFYTDLSQSIVDTVQGSGGIMETEDLASYQVRLVEPVRAMFDGHTYYSPPAPSGGPVLMYMLQLLDLFQLDASSDIDLSYHLLIEVFKFAYSERTRLGDPYCESSDDVECQESLQVILEAVEDIFNKSFVHETWSKISVNQTFNVSYYHPDFSQPVDDGTSHISVLSPEGDAVAVTTTVNTGFGANLMTDTGIILNDEMDDFSAPNVINSYGFRPSKANYIFPGKRPQSSTCPTVGVSSDGKPYMIVGGAGGSRITTAVAQVIMLASIYGNNITDAIESRRLHHQLVPNVVRYERNFPSDILDYLETKGHREMPFPPTVYAVVQGILVQNNVTAHADSRKQGGSVVVHSN